MNLSIIHRDRYNQKSCMIILQIAFLEEVEIITTDQLSAIFYDDHFL